METSTKEPAASIDSTQRQWLERMRDCLGLSAAGAQRAQRPESAGDGASSPLRLSAQVNAELQKEFDRINKMLDELIDRHQAND
jgi:hypothetical protein